MMPFDNGMPGILGGSPGQMGGLPQQLGLNPQMLDQLRQSVAHLPPDQQVEALRQNLMQVPGVRETLMQRANPMNPSVTSVAPPPDVMTAAPQPLGAPDPRPAGPNAGQGQAGSHGAPITELNQGMQKRQAAGKALPPGIARRYTPPAPAGGNAAVSGPARSGSRPRQGGTATTSIPPLPTGMTSQTGGGLQALPTRPQTSGRFPAAGGAGMEEPSLYGGRFGGIRRPTY